MKARIKGNKRIDSKGNVLKKGESQRPNGTYVFTKQVRGVRTPPIYAKTLEELRTKIAAIERDEALGLDSSGRSLTLNASFDKWYKQKESKMKRQGMREKTYNNYGYMYNHWVRDSKLGKMKLKDIRKSDIIAFYHSLSRTMSDNTINNIQTVLHQVFEMALDDEMIFRNPSHNAFRDFAGEVKKKSKGNQEKKSLTFDEEMCFREHLEHIHNSEHWKPIFTVFLETGMRCCELSALRWCDIDLNKGTIDVNHDFEYCSHSGVFSTKVNENLKTLAGRRVIPMSQAAKDAFIAQREHLNKRGIKCKANIDGYTDFIFLNRYGNVYHEELLNQALKRIIAQLDPSVAERFKSQSAEPVILHITTHTFRHTLATRMNECGINLKVRQQILGHLDPEVTTNIYTDVTDKLMDSELARFRSIQIDEAAKWENKP